MRIALIAVALPALVTLPALACKQAEPTGTSTTTSVEIADPLPTDQSNSKDDLALLQCVRQRLVAGPGLSVRARNAVVVVKDGVVTLRGEVADRVEHDLVVANVASIPLVVRVDDRLTFKE